MDLLAHCQAENERLRKLVEPKEWLGWDQVDSIYDEARLLRKERDEAREQLRGAVEENERLRERVASLMLEEPSKTAGLYAAIDELQARLTERGGQSE
jgi:hypothetical protein